MMNQQSEIKNGLIAAAMLAAGIGCLFLGIMTSLSEAIHPVGNALNWYNPVGALTGKTIVAIVLWLVSWAILASKWRDQEVDFGKVYMGTLILVALGLLGTFPLFFGLL
jgi:peptidoglycan biosynthesis protein MviN/MurJ (putative lipid II flippase)